MKYVENHHLVLLLMLFGILFFLAREDVSSKTIIEPMPQISSAYVAPVSTPLQISHGKYEYLEITQSCDPYFNGHCIPAYASPSISSEHVSDLRSGMIFKIKSKVEVDGQVWYRVYFDEWLRYPERVQGDWYIPAVAGRVVTDNGAVTLSSKATTTKRITVDLTNHMLYAYDGDKEFLITKVSTGIESTPTPTGTFTIFKKMPTRYMQGPIKGVSDVAFDLPGVPWNMYFTQDGAVIHGSYWHDRYGTEQSNGCINLPSELAKILYDWADLGTTVTIRR